MEQIAAISFSASEGTGYPTESGSIAASLLQGCIVVDRAGKEIGDVEDIMIDLASGQISHVLLSYGDWLNNKTLAVPWRALKIDTATTCLVLQTDIRQIAGD